MPDSTGKTDPAAAGPKWSRWALAGLACLAAPFVAGLTPSLAAHFTIVLLAGAAASWTCAAIAVKKLKRAGIARKPLHLRLLNIGAILAGILWLLVTILEPLASRMRVEMSIGGAYELSYSIKAYETQYGRLPAPDGPVQDYARLVATLSAKTPENPRGIPFLPARTNPPTGRPEFKDPWGNDFKVVLSSSGGIKAGTGGIFEDAHNSVAIWSLGPNKADDHGEYDKQHGKDDINSWQ